MTTSTDTSDTSPANLTATDARAQIKAGTLTSEALTNACIAQITAREPDVQAWTYFDPEHALTQARAADARQASGEPLGPLHGLPVGIKDIIATADMPTEDGTPANKGRQPDQDAACVQALREAGAIIMGKTVTTELATRHPGKTRNPHNTAHTPGGSSSGSAAGVACGMIPLALGTQTGGSVTRPASFCGIYGLKPTLGLISRTGVTLQSHTLDTVGVYARSIADLALITDALSASDQTDKASYPRPSPACVATLSEPVAKPPRLGFIRTPAWSQAEPAAQKAILDFVATHSALIEEVESPAEFAGILEDHRTVQYAENSYHFADIEARARDLLSPALQNILDDARTIPAAQYMRALATRRRAYDAFATLLDQYDAVVCLSACGPAPKGLDSTGNPIFNGLWTLLGVPSVTLPKLTVDGLPLGIQVIGKRREDARVLRTADWLDRQT